MTSLLSVETTKDAPIGTIITVYGIGDDLAHGSRVLPGLTFLAQLFLSQFSMWVSLYFSDLDNYKIKI